MKLYDSLSTKLKNINFNKEIKIYTCGPTVYDYIHIGNARPLVLTDLIIRLLKTNGAKVKFLMNITDVDDKIIAKASKENKTSSEISEFYIDKFKYDINSLNISKPQKYLKVTDNIEKFIILIADLIAKNYAYEKNGNVFFNTSKIKDYGILSKNKKELLISSQNNKGKKNSMDFALWKKTEVGVTWKSPWSNGRPGWHTECFAFIDLFFDNGIDLHIGGVDLKFPHHENERAIFMAKEHKEIAEIWVHNGHINLDNIKMSKSLGNIIYTKDFIKAHGANVLKYILYTKRYKQPLNITDTLIQFATKEVAKISNLINRTEVALNNNILEITNNIAPIELINKFLDELYNDLNSANALEILKKMAKSINILMRENKLDLTFYNLFLKAIFILGFDFADIKNRFESSALIIDSQEKIKKIEVTPNIKLNSKK